MTTPPPSPENIRLENIREEATNTILAELLRDYGLPAREKCRLGQSAPDIQVTLKTGVSSCWNAMYSQHKPS